MLSVNTHVTPPPALGDGEGKVSSLICRSYGHLCSAPLETCFIFSEKKKKKSMLKLYQVKTTLPMSALCYLLSQLNTFL